MVLLISVESNILIYLMYEFKFKAKLYFIVNYLIYY